MLDRTDRALARLDGILCRAAELAAIHAPRKVCVLVKLQEQVESDNEALQDLAYLDFTTGRNQDGGSSLSLRRTQDDDRCLSTKLLNEQYGGQILDLSTSTEQPADWAAALRLAGVERGQDELRAEAGHRYAYQWFDLTRWYCKQRVFVVFDVLEVGEEHAIVAWDAVR